LDTELSRAPAPRFRSTALPPGTAAARPAVKSKPAPAPAAAAETVFENFKRGPLTPAPDAEPANVYNDLGLRRYDLPSLWNRIRNYFQAPTTGNPRLVDYLAAGGVQGLRPLRYEKRIARRRTYFYAALLLAMMLGIIWVFYHH